MTSPVLTDRETEVAAPPELTLVVPVRDEERSLDALLLSIDEQTRSPDHVVFVDGGSVDGTAAHLRAACAQRPTWRLIEAGPATPGRGRNLGIASATTDWVALTDAGIELDRHWLERLGRVAAADPTLDVVYGHYEPAPGGFFVACAALAYVEAPRATARGPVRDHSVASCMLRRELWDRAGRFPDLRAGEDRQFMRRVEALGARAAEAPEARANWFLAPSPRSTFRRFRLYSRVNAASGEQRNWHHAVARHYGTALVFVGLAYGRRAWLVVPLLGFSARVARSIWARREGRGLWWAANPARAATVGAVLLTIDAAMFVGWAQALLPPRRET